MGNWAKIIYDKLPVLYGQLCMQGYLEDPAISFCAIGDANCDKVPLQVCQFARGADIDEWIAKIFLEGGGGGNNRETYELAAYYYASCCTLPSDPTAKPYFFFTGDEGCFPRVLQEDMAKVCGVPGGHTISTEEAFLHLRTKFKNNVFFIHKPFWDDEVDRQNLEYWERLLGPEHILHLNDAKAVVDVILGAIAVSSGSRTLDRYFDDMHDRGQTDLRLRQVNEALSRFASTLAAPAPAPPPAPARPPLTEEEIHLRDRLHALHVKLGAAFPEEYICPFTMKPMLHPATAADGRTYERANIKDWLAGESVSPVTNEPLPHKSLVPNDEIRRALLALLIRHRV